MWAVASARDDKENCMTKPSIAPSSSHQPSAERAAIPLRRRPWRSNAGRFSIGLALAIAACAPADDGPEPAVAERELRALQPGDRSPALDYTSFEADPVRPVAVLEKSGWVAVANTPDDYLELFKPTRRAFALVVQ